MPLKSGSSIGMMAGKVKVGLKSQQNGEGPEYLHQAQTHLIFPDAGSLLEWKECWLGWGGGMLVIIVPFECNWQTLSGSPLIRVMCLLDGIHWEPGPQELRTAFVAQRGKPVAAAGTMHMCISTFSLSLPPPGRAL